MTPQEVKKTIEEILAHSPLHVESVESVIEDDGTVWYTIRSNDSHLFIGRNGENLEAWNHLIRKILDTKTKEAELTFPMIFDVNEYQRKKAENLKAVAHMMAERARFFKASVSIDPMSAFERKIVHTFLQNAKDLKTESEGMGKDRHIVIKYVG